MQFSWLPAWKEYYCNATSVYHSLFSHTIFYCTYNDGGERTQSLSWLARNFVLKDAGFLFLADEQSYMGSKATPILKKKK